MENPPEKNREDRAHSIPGPRRSETHLENSKKQGGARVLAVSARFKLRVA